MNRQLLSKARIAKDKFTNQTVIDPGQPTIKSIINQLEFIISCTENGDDPRKKLQEGQTFTYSVIASRSFASPDELDLRKYLDQVSRELYPEDY